jgi:hypothetical protein
VLHKVYAHILWTLAFWNVSVIHNILDNY